MNTKTKTSKKARSVPVKTDFPVWKTIRLGTGLKTATDFRKVLIVDFRKAAIMSGNHIGDCGNDILGRLAFTAVTEETEVDLVIVSVSELGFKDGATRKDIYARALELGLQLCPNEVGPQLRLQYKDQPNGEWLLIGMEPITDSRSYPRVFGVLRHDGGMQFLDGSHGDLDYFWLGCHRWVFMRPRKSA
jgi:hypothetical protein